MAYTTLSNIDPNTSAPVIVSYNPLSGASGVGYANNIVLTFSEAVHQGTSGTIELHKLDATGPQVLVDKTFNGNVLTIDPTIDLLPGTQYYISLGNGAVQDSTGENFAGYSYNFTTGYTSNGVDPYAGSTSGGGDNKEVAFAGLVAAGLLQWLLL